MKSEEFATAQAFFMFIVRGKRNSQKGLGNTKTQSIFGGFLEIFVFCAHFFVPLRLFEP